MRTTHFIRLFGLFLLIVLASACSDDEQSTKVIGDLTVNGTDYAIARAYISNFSDFKMGADLDGDGKGDMMEMKTSRLSLTTDALEANNTTENFEGNGNLLLISLPETLATTNTNYPAGEYTVFRQVRADLISFSDDERWDTISTHYSGSLRVSKSGSTYTVEGELVNETSGAVTCAISFRGALTDFPGLSL